MFTDVVVAIDGSKFKAVNAKRITSLPRKPKTISHAGTVKFALNAPNQKLKQ
jgi:hypothetical protein